ncbi:MAG: hypothetical protein FJ038_03790 [Chloroflexi bacterium]|nr:hypothetical protein [Chloroflexota bacterium]
MPTELLIPLAIFVAPLAMFGLLLLRTWLLVLESRELASFRRAVRDLARRLDETLDAMVIQVDRVRRHQVDVASVSEGLDQALERMLEFGAEAQNLGGPATSSGAYRAFVEEIDRAERALQMVEHGCAILSTPGGNYRQAEAETAIKRGYLNVVHARAGIARHAADIDAVRPARDLPSLRRRRNAVRPD